MYTYAYIFVIFHVEASKVFMFDIKKKCIRKIKP